MKFTKNVFMASSLLLQVGVSFAAISEGRAILDRLDRELSNGAYDPQWEHSGPTREDILAATKVENLAAKGSLEDKLISAVKRGDLKKVEALIALGPDLEARVRAEYNQNFTALIIAAKNGFTDIARLLIKAGADVDATDRYNWPVLSHAANGGHAEIVKLLIANGAAKGAPRGAENQKNFKEFFVSAVGRGYYEVAKALLVEGSGIDQDTVEEAFGLIVHSKRNRETCAAFKELITKGK